MALSRIGLDSLLKGESGLLGSEALRKGSGCDSSSGSLGCRDHDIRDLAAATPVAGLRFCRLSDSGRSLCGMAYDEDLADRIRELVGREAGLTEKKMFGGLAFLVNGNMAVAASGQGGLLVRVDPADGDRFASQADVEPMVMRGREMAGWLRVADSGVATKRSLTTWVNRGVSFARSLPPK